MLRPIYELVSTKIGRLDEATFLTYVNAAVRELWDVVDPLIDEVMIKADSPLITLPWFVERPRAIKNVGRGEQLALYTPRPWYGENIISDYRFVVLDSATPLQRSLATASTLVIRRPVADTAIAVAVTGYTRSGSSTRLSVSLPIGVKSAETNLPFTGVTSITRNVQDSCDTEVVDAEGIVVSVIPMDLYQARYQRLRISGKDFDQQMWPCCLAIYYKPVTPSYRYIDSALDPRLANIIQNKVMELVMIGSPEESQANAAAIYAGKSKAALANRAANDSIGKTIPINTGENPHDYQRIHRTIRCF